MNAYRVRKGDNAYGPPLPYAAAFGVMKRRLKRAGGRYSIWTSATGWGDHRRYLRTITRLSGLMLAADPGSRIRVMTDAENHGVIFTVKVIESIPAGTVQTPYGYIYPTTGPCRDDYPNIVTFTSKAGGQGVKLQEPAALSFQAVERAVGPVKLTGSWRSCSEQTALYARDPHRFANPAVTGHPRGICIDVDTGAITPEINAALAQHGWHMARADEGWHHSYWETR